MTDRPADGVHAAPIRTGGGHGGARVERQALAAEVDGSAGSLDERGQA